MSEKDKHYMILLIGGISIRTTTTTTTTKLKQNKNRFIQRINGWYPERRMVGDG